MHAIEQILVPTDFSACAELALRYATRLAKATGAQLCLYHACHVPTNPHASLGMGRLGEQLQRNAQEEMQELAARFDWEGVPHRTEVEMGLLTDMVARKVETDDIDLVVIGTQGASGLGKLMGSNAAAVIDRVDCPVLAVPARATLAPTQKILFASDLGELQTADVLRPLVTLAKALGAHVHILKVETDVENITRPPQQLLAEAFAGVPHAYHMVVDDDVDDGIQAYVEEHQMDMLAMMPRRHSFFARLFGASVTREMAYKTNVPLLAFHDRVR